MQPTERFHEALDYAVRLHAAQRRKGSDTPYFAHLLSVTAIVLEHGGDEDEAIAALLHDAIEDQGGAATRDQIQRRFGDRVAAIVEGCTDADTMPKPPWRERKEKYIAHLATAQSFGAAGVGGRQAAQCPLDSRRLSPARRTSLATIHGRARRIVVVLPRSYVGIASAASGSVDRRAASCRRRTGAHRQRVNDPEVFSPGRFCRLKSGQAL